MNDPFPIFLEICLKTNFNYFNIFFLDRDFDTLWCKQTLLGANEVVKASFGLQCREARHNWIGSREDLFANKQFVNYKWASQKFD